MDVTKLMLAYRECARAIWNDTMRPDAEPYVDFDAVDAFRTIQAVVFEQLVLRPLRMSAFKRTTARDVFPFLLVRPKGDSMPAMVNRPSPDRNLYWDDPVTLLRKHGLSAAFIGFHDWSDFGYIDMQHYRVRIEQCSEHPHLVGREALIDVHHADVVFEGPAQSPRSRPGTGTSRATRAARPRRGGKN